MSWDIIQNDVPGHYNGGGKGIRTPDLLHAMQTRYQLRHTPVPKLIRSGTLI